MRKSTKRWFRLDHGNDGPPGLMASTSSQAEIDKLILAFQREGIAMVEVNAAEAQRIQRQQNAADAAQEE